MPADALAHALVTLHGADSRDGLCEALGAALGRMGPLGFTLLLPGHEEGDYVAVASNVLAPEARSSFIVMEGDPLLLQLDDAGEFIAGVAGESQEMAWFGTALCVSAVLELKGGGGRRDRLGYLLLHDSPATSAAGPEAPRIEAVQVVDSARIVARHLEVALDRLQQMSESRATCWNKTEALDAMNEMGRLMGTLDLRILLTKILQLTLQMGSAEVGSIVLSIDGEVKSQFEWGFTEEALRSLKTPEGRLFVEEVIAGGEPVYVPNLYLDPRVDTGEGMLPIESLVVLPLVTNGGTLGAINVVNVSEETGFNQDRLSTLTTICSLAAIAIENARYHEEALKNEQLKEQARIAETIQKGFFPRFVPDVPGYQLAGRTAPAQFVGGDYYDWIPLPEGRLGVAVADVSGHGISAGLVMTLTRTFFRAEAPQIDSPAELFRILNHHLMAEELNGAYVTFMYGVLDPHRQELRFSSAGHVPLVHYVAAEDRVEFIEMPSLPIGMFDEAEYEDRIVPVAPGDLFLFLTDGVGEAMNNQRQQFGDGRLSALLRRLRLMAPREILDELHTAVQRHTQPGQPHDDVTTVLLSALPPAA